MKITLYGTAEPEALARAYERALRYGGPDCVIEITCRPRAGASDRDPPGWLEYVINFMSSENVSDYTIGMIQRSVGAEWEFHS